MSETQRLQELLAALVEGDHRRALETARALRGAGMNPERIVIDGIEPAMQRMDDKCTVEQFNLLELMLTGRAIGAVIKELYPEGTPPEEARATLVVATLEGDVHELGKNILKTVLQGKGFRVIDCGKDCPVSTFVDTAVRERAAAALVSGLMTTVIPQVRHIRGALWERGLEIPVIAGGAALKQATAEELNVDFVAQNAFDGAHYIDRLLADARNRPRGEVQP